MRLIFTIELSAFFLFLFYFNGISTIEGYLIPKPSFQNNSSDSI